MHTRILGSSWTSGSAAAALSEEPSPASSMLLPSGASAPGSASTSGTSGSSYSSFSSSWIGVLSAILRSNSVFKRFFYFLSLSLLSILRIIFSSSALTLYVDASRPVRSVNWVSKFSMVRLLYVKNSASSPNTLSLNLNGIETSLICIKFLICLINSESVTKTQVEKCVIVPDAFLLISSIVSFSSKSLRLLRNRQYPFFESLHTSKMSKSSPLVTLLFIYSFN